ncbi:4a-hydroxytetrahydrobiopterin dehydratase [Thiobacillus sp.]|uniref:4a-hydroxytetrahydrobiopterin dehydratase n=1 Tax=Thiobacillus sp. TaxID=924 RepID=UPI0025E3CD9D|nr:4a-hydroxytetrahydrobiopterin dehydratase [Thiobacillus sp.]
MPEDNNPIPHWQRQDLPPMLTRRFEFETYAETRRFLDGVAKLAEEAGLYPNLSFGKPMSASPSTPTARKSDPTA